MSETIKILWVEEETENALAEKRAYLETLWNYDVNIAGTYDQGKKALKNLSSYDVVIIDIRVPRDFDHNQSDRDIAKHSNHNRYGLDLIIELHKLQASLNKLMIYTNESWIDIEEEIEKLDRFGKSRFLQKKDCRSNKDFEEFILRIYNNSQKI